ncbi:MAG: hypothetical protein ACK4FF_09010 [Limnobacter sp.]|uniref:hypothetical protein n=1 Tax=Limnobacter sp. TaxID=2003368 RepID=UPI00391CDD16
MSTERLQRGYSMVQTLLALTILAFLVGSHLSLMAYITTGPNQAGSDELLNQLTRLGESFSTRAYRGGGFLDSDGEAKGIMVCTLDNSGNQCNTYNDNQANLCIALPIQNDNGPAAYIEVRGFRLLNGKLQQKGVRPGTMAGFDVRSFCGNAGWENLHSTDEFVISNWKLCRFSAATAADIRRDYVSSCPSILSANKGTNMFWLSFMEATPRKVGGTTVEQTRVIQLFNDTRVTTP